MFSHRCSRFWAVLAVLSATASLGGTGAVDPAVADLLARVAVPSREDLRGQVDTVGYPIRAAVMDRVRKLCEERARPRRETLEREGIPAERPFVGGVCPHDDYYYAGRLYALLLPHVRARRVILFGVFHKARVFGCRDRLVFGRFHRWTGPYGPIPVSPLRDELLRRLPRDAVVVNDTMQAVEHSVEAILPFLQSVNRSVEIVPILVPYMGWERMEALSDTVASALARISSERGWRLGEDVAILCSADAVHYGDYGWGKFTYAPFGIGLEGYRKAVARDRSLAEHLLAGPLRTENLKEFLTRCVDPADPTRYRITWCGRFSVPFGLSVLAKLAAELEGRTVRGALLDYGTSIDEASLDSEGLGGLGPTAPNNLHHFVGYAAIGYW
jgi:AmmeMemoRadiSam system protein B